MHIWLKTSLSKNTPLTILSMSTISSCLNSSDGTSLNTHKISDMLAREIYTIAQRIQAICDPFVDKDSKPLVTEWVLECEVEKITQEI